MKTHVKRIKRHITGLRKTFAIYISYKRLILLHKKILETNIYKNCIKNEQNIWRDISLKRISSVQSLSCVRLCNPTDCNMPGFPVHHQLPELTQIHVHRVHAIQSPHLLSSPSPLAFNLSQHQGLFQWVSSSHQVDIRVSTSASVPRMNIQD